MARGGARVETAARPHARVGVGVALDPGTPVAALDGVLDRLDWYLVLTVRPAASLTVTRWTRALPLVIPDGLQALAQAVTKALG
jgi:hypothetical protein